MPEKLDSRSGGGAQPLIVVGFPPGPFTEALDRIDAGDETLDPHVVHRTEVRRKIATVLAGNMFGTPFGHWLWQEFVTIHDGYPKANITLVLAASCSIRSFTCSVSAAGGSASSCFTSCTCGKS